MKTVLYNNNTDQPVYIQLSLKKLATWTDGHRFSIYQDSGNGFTNCNSICTEESEPFSKGDRLIDRALLTGIIQASVIS